MTKVLFDAVTGKPISSVPTAKAMLVGVALDIILAAVLVSVITHLG